MRKFRLLSEAAPHIENGRHYVKGEIVASANDLVEAFRGKFEEVDPFIPDSRGAEGGLQLPGQGAMTIGRDQHSARSNALPKIGRHSVLSSKAVALKEPPKTEETEPDLGLDVTENFPSAGEQDFKVYRRSGEYFVYNADNLDKPFNEEGVSKAAVEGVIKKNI